ncbi:hypothetical protein FHG87_016326 [Trinorchestia longiramus]|nr:hypothetical protein FHG87_016326 [Trinorchestia longiramus]
MASAVEFKFPDLWKRHAVLMSIHAGHNNTDIANWFKVDDSFVRKVRRELLASDYNFEATAARQDHSRRSDCTRDAEFTAKVQEMVDNNPSMSMRAIARELEVNEKIIRQCVAEDLHYKSSKMKRGRILSPKMEENTASDSVSPTMAPKRANVKREREVDDPEEASKSTVKTSADVNSNPSKKRIGNSNGGLTLCKVLIEHCKS